MDNLRSSILIPSWSFPPTTCERSFPLFCASSSHGPGDLVPRKASYRVDSRRVLVLDLVDEYELLVDSVWNPQYR